MSADVYGTLLGYVFINDSITAAIRENNFNYTNNYRRVSVLFTFIKNDYQEREIFPHFYNVNKIKNIKLEKGNKATDWTPAPEDMQSRLQDTTNYIGVGKTDASATEKLDVNGYVKATGFKTSTGTANQALTANGDTFDLDSKENVANKATDLTSPNNTKYPTTLAVVNETKKATITVELISQLTTNFYAPNALRINSTSLISGSGTLTLKVNDVAYTLGNLIPQGAKITTETTSSSVYNLISIYE